MKKMELRTVRKVEFAIGIAAVLVLLLWVVLESWLLGFLLLALMIGWIFFIFVFRKCPQCGKFLRNYGRFCPRCGKQFDWGI